MSHFHLISIISGMRRGEQLQLKWRDLVWMERNVDGEPWSLVKITVRGETSKVRKTRKFVVRDIEYFDNLMKMLQPRYTASIKGSGKDLKFADTLIFSSDGLVPVTVRSIDYCFDSALTDANIEQRHTRDLVPYSFRHYFITQKINSGLSPMQVAEICGTSATQIEKTYYHTTEDKMVSNALASYYIKDGMLVPK